MIRSARWGACTALLLLTVSCDGGDRSPKGPVRVGVVLPLSGPDASSGEELLAGLRLAAERFDPQLVLEVRDGEGQPDVSVRRFRELSDDSQVQAIVGGWFASTARTLAAVSEPDAPPFVALSPLASPGETRAPTGTFVLHRFSALGEAGAGFAVEDLAARSAGIVRIPSRESSRTAARGFADAFRRSGGDVLWTLEPDASGALRPPPGPPERVEVVFVAGSSAWVRQYLALERPGPSPAIVATGEWTAEEVSELADDGVRLWLVSFFSDGDPAPAVSDFLDHCSESGITPSETVAAGWEAAQVLSGAARPRGGSREAIGAALTAGLRVEGVLGRLDVSGVSPPRESPAISALSDTGLVYLGRRDVGPGEGPGA